MLRKVPYLVGAAVLLLLAFPSLALIPPGAPGDANCDSEIKHDDLTAVANAIFGRPVSDGCTGVDANEDLLLSAADLVALLQPVVDNATTTIAVFLMGDGMGSEHIRAGRVLNGAALGFESFPVVVDEVDTSSLDTLESGEPTDSAAGATAFATGVRVRNGEVSRTNEMDLTNIGTLAAGAGKSVGVVTNSYLFDASPASWIAHTDNRQQLEGLADEYLEFAPDVLMGGAPSDDQFPMLDAFIERARARGYTVVQSREELEALDLTRVRRLLGLFPVDFDLGLPPYARVLFPIYGTPRILRTPEAIDPPLSQMAEAAVTMLSRNRFGFFLFVENENIDTMSHAGGFTQQVSPTLGQTMAGEVVELAESAERVIAELTRVGRMEESLVFVTADHECGGFSFEDDPAAGVFRAAPNHTAAPVALFATGHGADRFATVADNVDVFWSMRPSIR